MASFNQFADSSESYGTDVNFQANYRLTPAFLEVHHAAFEYRNRIWIGSYAMYGTDVLAYNALLTAIGIMHSTETPTPMTHAWYGGWIPIALAALYEDSLTQP